MTVEQDDLLTDWKATYGEIFPHRNPEQMRITDAELALGVLFSRKIEMALKTRVIEPAHAHGYKPEFKYELEEL